MSATEAAVDRRGAELAMKRFEKWRRGQSISIGHLTARVHHRRTDKREERGDRDGWETGDVETGSGTLVRPFTSAYPSLHHSVPNIRHAHCDLILASAATSSERLWQIKHLCS